MTCHKGPRVWLWPCQLSINWYQAWYQGGPHYTSMDTGNQTGLLLRTLNRWALVTRKPGLGHTVGPCLRGRQRQQWSSVYSTALGLSGPVSYRRVLILPSWPAYRMEARRTTVLGSHIPDSSRSGSHRSPSCLLLRLCFPSCRCPRLNSLQNGHEEIQSSRLIPQPSRVGDSTTVDSGAVSKLGRRVFTNLFIETSVVKDSSYVPP